MNKILIGIVVAVVVLVGGFFALNSYIYNEKQGDGPARSARDATYVVDGMAVKLGEGGYQYFGDEIRHDFNKDGREDTAFLITSSPGGSGTFYYAVAALNTEQGYEGSQAFFLGDRIAPQSTYLDQNDLFVVNFADRAPGEPMTASPTVGKSVWLFLDIFSMQFAEQNQGVLDPDNVVLDAKSWTWVKTDYADGRSVTPKQSLAFTLEFFLDEQRFSATTDCNRVAGTATEEGDTGLVFSEMISTKMYCEGSQENAFTSMLGDVESYSFSESQELVLRLSDGTMTFR